MSERFEIIKGDSGALFDKVTKGHGRDGQVKKAGLFGRSVKVQGKKLNAGSLVDFLNAKPEVDKKLKKGWFFGYGGSSNKEIRDLFNSLYPLKENNDTSETHADQSSSSTSKNDASSSQSSSNHDVQMSSTEEEFDAEKINFDDDNDMLRAMMQDPSMLKQASDRLKDDENFMIEAMKRYVYAVQYASDRLKDDENFMIEAVKRNGNNLYFASDRLKDNEEIVRIAVAEMATGSGRNYD